jgi:hypothetical protein
LFFGRDEVQIGKGVVLLVVVVLTMGLLGGRLRTKQVRFSLLHKI